MNWMGGARNRVKFEGERKIQQEFFERQKLASARSVSARIPAQKRKGLSQDLLALSTVSRVHSKLPAASSRRKPIRKVDLEKFQSCTRQIDEVEMGPCSPIQTPSKLLLSEGKLDRNFSFIKPQSVTECRPPSEVFTKPENILEYKTSRHNTETFVQKEQNFARKSDMFYGNFKNNPTGNVVETMTVRKPRDFSFSKPKPVTSFDKVGRTSELSFDPFASEDFQITPLLKYAKKRSLSMFEVVKHKKRKHSGESKRSEEDMTSKDRVHSFKNQHYTSTPANEFYEKSDKFENSEHFGGISPIFKGTSLSKDIDSGFNYKPRPIVATPNFRTKRGKPTQCQGEENTGKKPLKDRINNNASAIHCGTTEERFQCSDDDEDLTTHYHRDTRKSVNNDIQRNLGMSPYYKSQLGSSSSESVSSFSRCYITEDIYDSTASRGTHMMGPDQIHSGSLSKYKHSIRHRNDKKSPGSPYIENLDTRKGNSKDESEHIFETEISKPKFTDIEEDFHYKPMKPKLGISADIMNMYKIEEQKQIGTNKGEFQASDIVKQTYNRLSGGSEQEMPSPIPADEFPKHLLYPSDQLQDEIDKKLSQIVTDERRQGSDDLTQMPTKENIRFYKPFKPPIDDVLDEIKQLEEQDALSPHDSTDKVVNVSRVPPGQGNVSTESFEADAYLESEDLLLNADIGDMENTKQNCNDSVTGNLQKSAMLEDQENDEVKIAADDRCNSPDRFMLDKGTEAEGQISLDTVKQDETNVMLEGKLEGISETPKECSPMKCDDNTQRKQEHWDPSYRKDPDLRAEVSGKYAKVAEMIPVDKGDETVTFKQLQVPEISSGKNEYTQTDVAWSHQKTFVEASTSPFSELSGQEVSDAGIQCDLAPFPSLSGLAGKCLSVNTMRSLTTLQNVNERMENTGCNDTGRSTVSEKASTASIYIEKLESNCDDSCMKITHLSETSLFHKTLKLLKKD